MTERQRTVALECDERHDPKPFIIKSKRSDSSFVWSVFAPSETFCQERAHYRNGLHIKEEFSNETEGR